MKMVTRRGIFLWILCGLFVIGLGFLTYSLVNNSSSWVMKSYNSHIYSNGQMIAAGDITDRDGTLLSRTEDGNRVYNSDSGIRLATLHAVGDKKGFISTGVQTAYESELVGYSFLNGVYNIKRDGGGNNIQLTLDAEICKTAMNALGSHKGTVAVANYKTGDLICMVSSPTYDVNNIPYDIETNSRYEGAYINRFLTGLYTPGSTFKLVTAICALENLGTDVLERTYNCAGSYDVDGIDEDKIICNATHGTLSFDQALAKSCNCYFGQLAIDLGAAKLKKTAGELGLTSSLSISGRIDTAESRFYLKRSDADALTGWTGIGQGDTLVTPAAMLRLVCAIANDGTAVDFNIIGSLTDASGKNLSTGYTGGSTTLIDSNIASTMKSLMRNNVQVQYGDGNYSGLTLCAKSGTAQVDNVEAHNTAWFVGFMDDSAHPYAFVVVAEEGNSGSQTAGPIANRVLQAIVADD